ncbi:MAG: hypothetical protein E5V86_21620 [Mesorhizobium sp.]|nr:MAG: hypothetical protein E5V86_21620 [Mesorhizobium sp.]
MSVELLRAPLCPAGHFSHKEGDWPSHRLSPIASVERRKTPKLPIFERFKGAEDVTFEAIQQKGRG